MNTDEYRELVELIQNELRNAGAGQLADARLYTTRDEDTGELRPLPPKEHSIAMLEAFDRYLAMHDSETASSALARINECLTGPQVAGAAFAPPSQAAAGPSISLGAGPNLRAIREDLWALLHQLQEDDEASAPPSEATAGPSISLGAQPDLSAIRDDLGGLLDQLREDDESPEATD